MYLQPHYGKGIQERFYQILWTNSGKYSNNILYLWAALLWAGSDGTVPNQCTNMDPPMILGMQQVTGVEAWIKIASVQAWTHI